MSDLWRAPLELCHSTQYDSVWACLYSRMSCKVRGHSRVYVEWAHLGISDDQESLGKAAVTSCLGGCGLHPQGFQPSVWNPGKFCYKHGGLVRTNKIDTEPVDERFKAFGSALHSCALFYMLREVPLYSIQICCAYRYSQSDFCSGGNGKSRKPLFKQWPRAIISWRP